MDSGYPLAADSGMTGLALGLGHRVFQQPPSPTTGWEVEGQVRQGSGNAHIFGEYSA